MRTWAATMHLAAAVLASTAARLRTTLCQSGSGLQVTVRPLHDTWDSMQTCTSCWGGHEVLLLCQQTLLWARLLTGSCNGH